MSFQEDLSEFLDIEQGFAITAILHSANKESREEYLITGIIGSPILDSKKNGKKVQKDEYE